MPWPPEAVTYSKALLPLADFTLAVWLRSTMTAAGALLGRYAEDASALIVWLNTDEWAGEMSGAITVEVDSSMGMKTVSCHSVPLFDGLDHVLVITRHGTEIGIWVDGIELTTTVGYDSLGASDLVDVGTGLAVGAVVDSFGGFGDYAAIAVGELAIWARELGDAEIGQISAGYSARFTNPLPLLYWRGIDGTDRTGVCSQDDIGGGVWTGLGVLLDHHPLIGQPADEAIHQPNPNRFGGYDVYLTAGRSPDPATDVPVRRLPATANVCELLAADLVLAADTRYVLAVYPFLLLGHAATSPEAGFATSAGGVPSTLPTPVMGLSVEVRPGGESIVSWIYDELHEAALADTFRIQIQPLFEGGSAIVQDVTHEPPQREYAVTLTAAEGRYRAKVISMRTGLGEDSVPTVDFLLDATAPAGGILGLTAV